MVGTDAVAAEKPFLIDRNGEIDDPIQIGVPRLQMDLNLKIIEVSIYLLEEWVGLIIGIVENS